MRGQDAALWVRYFKSGVWQPWQSLGGEISSAPAASLVGNGKVLVAARSGTNQIRFRFYTEGKWSGWNRIEANGAPDSRPALVSSAEGRLDLFARGFEGELWYRHFETEWSDWLSLEGSLAGDPVAVSRAPGKIDVMAVSARSEGLKISFEGTEWGDWETEPLPPNATPELAINSWGPDRLDLFNLTTDGHLWHQSSDGRWTRWEDLGGELDSMPAAIAPAADTLEITGISQGDLVKKVWNGQWSAWTGLK